MKELAVKSDTYQENSNLTGAGVRKDNFWGSFKFGNPIFNVSAFISIVGGLVLSLNPFLDYSKSLIFGVPIGVLVFAILYKYRDK